MDQLDQPHGNAVVLVMAEVALADVVRDGNARGLDLFPHRDHRLAAIVDFRVVGELEGIERKQEGFQPQRLQLLEAAPRSCRIPPVDQTHGMEPAGRLALPLGDIFIVNLEAQLAQVEVGTGAAG